MVRRGEATARKTDARDPDTHASDRALLARRIVETSIEAVTSVPTAKVAEITQQWCTKADLDPDDPADAARVFEAMAFASFLALFTPGPLGSAPIERFVHKRRAGAGPEGRAALDALARAEFRLLRIGSRTSPHHVQVLDLANGDILLLFDADLPVSVAEVDAAAWLVPLPGDDFFVVGPLSPLDAAALAEGMSFVRPGKGLKNPRRCAAAVYRHVVRHGAPRIEGINAFPEDEAGTPDEDLWDDLDRLAAAFVQARRAEQAVEDLVRTARGIADVGHLVEALSRSVMARRPGTVDFAEAFREIGLVMLETLDRRAASGFGNAHRSLAEIAPEIERAITERGAPDGIRPLFEQLRAMVGASRNARSKAGGEEDELGRVLQRIQGLRAKTVDQGCTEQEALAAARKVAEMLDRYGLSIGEIEMRERSCEGIGVDTGRRRSAPVDDCASAIAELCDCRMWFETTATGSIRFVFFGLPEDVAAAHYLHELIVVTFKAETVAYKKRSAAEAPAGTRPSTRSFEIGLAHGIRDKLRGIKAEREASLGASGGRALAPIKSSIVEDELEKLGLSFHAKARGSKRRVTLDAYRAGVAAGRQFEPHVGVGAPTADRMAAE